MSPIPVPKMCPCARLSSNAARERPARNESSLFWVQKTTTRSEMVRRLDRTRAQMELRTFPCTALARVRVWLNEKMRR